MPVATTTRKPRAAHAGGPTANEPEALLALSRAVAEETGDDADRICLLGARAMRQGDYPAAVGCFSTAIKLRPDYALAFHLLGRCFRILGKVKSAQAAHRRACELDPTNGDAWAALGGILHFAGRVAEAVEAYRTAHEVSGKAAFLIRAMTLLPPVYESCEQIAESRELLAQAIAAMDEMDLSLTSPVEEGLHLFYLAYHGCDDRRLQEAMANFIAGKCEDACYVAPHLKRGEHRRYRSGRRKLRLALVSSNFRRHTIGKAFLGMVENFPRDRFEISVFSIAPKTDEIGERYRLAADRFLPLQEDLDLARREIAKRKPDILLYADIGMEAFTYGLAFSRLAPVQCVTWGHPATTGVPAIDYFLSARDLEVEGAEAHYSESLVRLPRVGCCYARPDLEIPHRRRSDFCLPEAVPLYICPQTAMKLHPEFDEILDDLLRRDGAGRVVLLKPWSEEMAGTVSARLERRLGDKMERVLFLENLPQPEFLALLSLCDVMLDPPRFGGGNTNYEACHVGLPVVTLPGDQMRTRFAYALYRQMGIAETIAADGDDYVEKAVEIANDPAERDRLRQLIESRSDAVFDDRGVLDEMAERFVEMMLRAQSTPGSGIKGAG